MVLIRFGGEIEFDGVLSLPSIDKMLATIPGYTEINGDESLLDGRYTAAQLRSIANVMDWHAKSEQRPIDAVFYSAVCLGCNKTLTGDIFGAPDNPHCFKCASKMAFA